MTTEDNKFVLFGPDPMGPIPDRNLGEEILQGLLSNLSEDDAMVDVYVGKTLSYKALLEQSCRLAEALRSYGCTTDTVVSISSENNVEFFIPIIASLFVGCTVAPINHNYTQLELQHNLTICKPNIVFCSHEVAPKFIQLKKELSYIDSILVIDSLEAVLGVESLRGFVQRMLQGRNNISPHVFQPFVGDPSKSGAFILCSSGTTGLPKGVLLSHRNVMLTVMYFRDPRFISISHGSTLGLMPFFHAYGLYLVLTSIIDKRKVLVLKRFDEDIFLRTIQDNGISMLPIVPSLATFLQKSPKVLNYDLSCIEEVLCGSAPLSKTSELELKKRLKNLRQIRQAYGLTEATMVVTVVETGVHKPGSSGRVVTFMSCKIRDPETGRSLAARQVGEICVKGPMVMMGYYDNEEATRASFTSDGWLRTGDLGYYDYDEYFYIVGRLKELIKYKGFQVAPAELEAILLTHPKVREAAVVGLPDDLSGELPLAFVIKAEGDVTEKELQDYVAGLVSPQKRLRGGVIFVSEIPKNATGKVLRRELMQRLKNHKPMIESKV